MSSRSLTGPETELRSDIELLFISKRKVPLGMTEPGRLMHLERSSVTGLVDRVEKRRLIERVADPEDRRACRVALTEDGGRAAARAHDGVVAQLDAMTGRLEHGAQEGLASAVAQLLVAQGFKVPPRRESGSVRTSS